MFKFHLGCILGTYYEEQQELNGSGPLLYYNPEFRKLIGTVLLASESLGYPGLYSPLFYQAVLNEEVCFVLVLKWCLPVCIIFLKVNDRMQQPLCHLYFLTVLEHLNNSTVQSKLSYSVNLAFTVWKELEELGEIINEESVLLRLEFQAIVQVMIQQIALHLDPKNPTKLGDLAQIIEDINRYIFYIASLQLLTILL